MDLKNAIHACKKNDRRAQEWLYKHHFRTMISMCMRFARDEDQATTFLNDGFLKVFKHLDSLSDAEKFVPWMKRILYRTICDHLRKKPNKIRYLIAEESHALTKNLAPDQLNEEDILKLLDKIPPASSEVFILYAIQGYNHREIAELQEISIGTSKWHLAEARKKLKELLFKNNIAPGYAQ